MYLKHIFALVLKNNSILIYNKQTNKIEFHINDISSSIAGIYLNPIQDYFYVLTNNAFVHFWSLGNKRFERKGLFSQYSELFFDSENL